MFVVSRVKSQFLSKLMLCSARWTVVSLLVLCWLGNTMRSFAQLLSEGRGISSPAFEVASIRPNDPSSMVNMVRMNFDADGYSATHTTAMLLIKDAYGVDEKQILGLPKWTSSSRYDIEARIDSATAGDLSRQNEDQRKLAHQRMLQSLLADRFKLKLHKEHRELPVFSLVIAKTGSKLEVSRPGDNYASGLRSASGNTVGPHMMLMRLGGGQIGGQGVRLEVLVEQLTSQLGRLVQDKTGLTGNYDFNLTWAPDVTRLPMSADTGGDRENTTSGAAQEPSGPSIFTALQEQLGLKLEPQRSAVEVLVVDSVGIPTEN